MKVKTLIIKYLSIKKTLKQSYKNKNKLELLKKYLFYQINRKKIGNFRDNSQLILLKFKNLNSKNQDLTYLN